MHRTLTALFILLTLVPAMPCLAGQDVVLVLDNSGSMRTNDPNRLAPKAVADFVNSRNSDTRVSLIEFATQPVVLMPLTSVDDSSRAQALAAVQRLDYRGQWTDTGAALERALYELDQHGRSDAQRYIILMTDGMVDVGSDARNTDKLHWITQSLIPEAVNKRVRIFGIAFTDQADFELLQTLAQKTGAGYYRAYQAGDLEGIFSKIGDTLVNSSLPLTPIQEAAAPQPAAAAPQAFNFSTPLTHPEDGGNGGSHLIWFWFLILLLVVILASAAYLVWSRGGIKAVFGKGEGASGAQHDGPQAVLYDISNPNDIKRYDLSDKATVIGRVAGYDPEVQYVLAAEPTVGRCHALIERRGHSYWLTDQGSINGTFVNGERVTADHVLKHGDIIAVHRHEFEFVLPELYESESTVLAAREELGYADKPGA